MLRSILLATVAASLLAPGSCAQESRPVNLAVTLPTFPNVNCPIMGKPTSTSLFVDTPMGRIYTCCAPCNGKIRKDPVTAHKAAYPKITRIENKTCPVTGKSVPAEAPTLVLQGYEFNLCCKDCVSKARDDSQIVLTKLVYPNVRDVGNAVCPLTGRPVEKNAFVLIGDDLVHLSSTRCFQVVAHAPQATLEKAKASAPVAEARAGAVESRPSRSNEGRDGR